MVPEDKFCALCNVIYQNNSVSPVIHMQESLSHQPSFAEAAFKMAKRTKKVGITGKYGTR